MQVDMKYTNLGGRARRLKGLGDSMAALRCRLTQGVSEVVCSADNTPKVGPIPERRRLRVKDPARMQSRCSSSSPRCSFRCVLAVLRDVWPTDFEGSSLGMHQAEHIRPYSWQGCCRIAWQAITPLRPDSGRSRLPPAAPCALPCWHAGLLHSPEVVRAVGHAGGTPGGSPRRSILMARLQ